MAVLRYRAREWTGLTVIPWQRWDDPTMSDEAFQAIWGADFEVAIEDEDDPNLLIMLPLDLGGRWRLSLDTLQGAP